MSRRGDNIHKRKDGRWEGRYKKVINAAGKAIYGSVYAHSYSECKHRLHPPLLKKLLCTHKNKQKVIKKSIISA